MGTEKKHAHEVILDNLERLQSEYAQPRRDTGGISLVSQSSLLLQILCDMYIPRKHLKEVKRRITEIALREKLPLDQEYYKKIIPQL